MKETIEKQKKEAETNLRLCSKKSSELKEQIEQTIFSKFSFSETSEIVNLIDQYVHYEKMASFHLKSFMEYLDLLNSNK